MLELKLFHESAIQNNFTFIVGMNQVVLDKQQRALKWMVVMCALLIALTRLVVYLRCNLQVVDSDQFYMWQGASDYAKGLFYEPRYYGQNYNTFMEALFAVPLLWLKVPVYFALPLVTHFISLFPYFFIAFYLCLYKKYFNALIVFLLLVFMPISYDVLNGLPRGFITGLFFCSFFILNFIHPNRFFILGLNAFLSLIAYFVNPNSVLVSFPFLFYFFLLHYNTPRYYYFIIPALLMYLPLSYFFNGFYNKHPEYVMQPLENSFSMDAFVQNISHLNSRFASISIVTEGNCALLLMVMAGLGCMLFKQNKLAFWAYIFFTLLLLIAFFSGKTTEGSTWVFMPYSRMYLGIPLLMCIFSSQIIVRNNRIAIMLFFLSFVFLVYKLHGLNPFFEESIENKNWSGVRLSSLDDCFNTSAFYGKVCDDNGVEFLLVSSCFWQSTILSAAGSLMHSNYPETSETWKEKRYWIREKNKNRVLEKFIFLSSDYDFDKSLTIDMKFELQRLDNFGLYLIKNNSLSIGKFIEVVNRSEPIGCD